MTIDTSTTFVIAMLIFAASLASYALSIWPTFRSNRMVVLTGLGVGTALLLAAAVLIAFSTNALSTLWFSTTVSASNETRRTTPDIPFPRSDEFRKSANEVFVETAADPHSELEGSIISKPSTESWLPSRGGVAATSAMAINPVRSPHRGNHDSGANRTSFVPVADPWSATTCVIAIQPDPAEPTLWWLENECSAPVAILFATCAVSAPACSEAGSTSWRYQTNTQLLPAKHQRSVTYAEQTQRGEWIRFVACTITTRQAIEQIGEDITRPLSRVTLEDSGKAHDECLTQTDRWLDVGRRTGMSIDTLLGNGVPGRVRQAR